MKVNKKELFQKPSLQKINWLIFVFVPTGQQLLVPDKSKLDESDATSDTSGDRSRKISSDDLPEEKGNSKFLKS
jgi:hypothetical protein